MDDRKIAAHAPYWLYCFKMTTNYLYLKALFRL